MRKLIVSESGERVFKFIEKHVSFCNKDACVLSTTTLFNVEYLEDEYYNNIINLKRINDIRRINKFFNAVNEKLPKNGLFIGCVETYDLHYKKIIKEYPPILNVIYYFFDFIFSRIFPKLPIAKQIYFSLTKGVNRVISRPEALGRLYSCGFKVLDEQYIDLKLYFVAQKVKEPIRDMSPSYGYLFNMKRIGKKGKIIKVYKFRTMHPYSEYLQEYVYEKNNLDEGGKLKDDFRVTKSGKFMRKFWIDELPMIINFFKGDLKIVGVRPISKHYLSLYSDEVRNFRIKFKPGLIPPYYADMPKTIEEIQASEMKYLKAYQKNPIITDIRYFFVCLYNIFIKKARSK